jgi:hypothetical protein
VLAIGVSAIVGGTTLLSTVVICSPGCSLRSGGALASHNNTNAAKPVIAHAPILIVK